MRLLLDSHAFLWFCEGNPNLSAAARAAIEALENAKFISHVTAWEIATKASLKKLQLNRPVRRSVSKSGCCEWIQDARGRCATL
jgi:PIN domain nuclease of toxin-antitoxin system